MLIEHCTSKKVLDVKPKIYMYVRVLYKTTYYDSVSTL